ncbi:hypothetical protein [Martelella endophytica]|uniref:Uncharacterized protein n=1 Tax=Martelella endophytica TaxID=1486262 RepID=A0A0D5LRW5_MAREN|nr:hypothetical protein [Martelella endophytica]AJY46512.1 hypothetical protein TM49_13820 [Martelella endophytica]
MNVYLVRSADTKQLHGIVWGNLDQIWDVVDEVAEPSDFEFAKLSPGGLFSEVGIEPRVSDDTHSPDEPALPNGGYLPPDLDPSEVTFYALTEPDCLRWRRFDDTLAKHGLVSRIFAAVDGQNGGDA